MSKDTVFFTERLELVFNLQTFLFLMTLSMIFLARQRDQSEFYLVFDAQLSANESIQTRIASDRFISQKLPRILDHAFYSRLEQQLTEFAATSPDGNQLAYVSQDNNHIEKLMIRDLIDDKNKIVFQASSKTDQFRQFSWSPDGKYLAFYIIYADGSKTIVTLETDSFQMVFTEDIAHSAGMAWITPADLNRFSN